MQEQLAPCRAPESEWERQMLRTEEVKHYTRYAMGWRTATTNSILKNNDRIRLHEEACCKAICLANLPQIRAEHMPQDFSIVLPKLWRENVGHGCRANKTPALSRLRKVAHHAGKKRTLVGLAAAVAPRVVGGAGGGLPLAAGHENNGSAGCAEQRTGRTVCVAWSQGSPRFCWCLR